ncbi:hypothetical protein [Sinomonas susongensis]|uniref:hypothetical protein n=1 Tax=Sinomonas susongensis TaxID=1324851 RepID=UPI0014866EC4|nr:hypothetical protein [Sinomonas susongensis]
MMPPSLTAAFAFERVRFLAAVGWNISLRMLAWLAITATVIVALLTFGAGLIALWLLCILEAEGVISVDGAPGSAAALATVITVFYITGGACLREIFGPRRLAVQCNPNRGLFRALDVEMRHVFIATCGPRCAVVLLTSASLAASAITALAMSGCARPILLVLLTATPLTATAAVLGIGGWLATHEARPLTSAFRAIVVMLGSAALGIPAFVLTRLLSGGLGPWNWSLPALWEPVAAGTVASGLGAAHILSLSWRRMARDSFPLCSRGRIRLPPSYRAGTVTGALWLNLVRSPHQSAIASTVSAVTLVASVVSAVRLAGVNAETLGPLSTIGGFLPWMAFIAALTVAELLSKDNGPVVLVPRLRVLWENGIAARTLIAGVLGTQVGFTAVLLSPAFGIIGWAVTGAPFWAAPSVIAATVSASLLGSSVSTAVVKHADGSADVTLAAALLTLLAASPAGLLALLPGAIGVGGSSLYAIILLGVVALCLHRRIIYLPSVSRE